MIQVPSAVGRRMCPNELEPVRELANHKKYTVGLDLAKARDFAALAVIESQLWESARCGLCMEPHQWRKAGLVRVEQIPRGTPYPAIVDRTAAVMRSRLLLGRCVLIMDATGVGGPVVDMVDAEDDLPRVAVTLAGGDNIRVTAAPWRRGKTAPDRWDCTASKVRLVSDLAAALQSSTLAIAGNAPGVALLAHELAELRRSQTAAGNVKMEAASGEHDDLVLAVALAYWGAVSWQVPKVGFQNVRLPGI